MSFSHLGLSEKVLAAVAATGYTTPTPIQEQAIPHVLARRDVLGIAQTGTGKTAAFVLPMLTMLEKGRARARMPRTLILEPTRELAAQVKENFDKYGAGQKLNVALIIGGVSFGDQDTKLTRGVDVLIATPGRLLDHTERGGLLLTGVAFVLGNETRSLIAGEGVAPIVMDRLKETLARIDCITELDEIATLHLGPGAILVALTLAFRPRSTSALIDTAIVEITKCLQAADGRVAYVYVRPSRKRPKTSATTG